MNPQVSKEMWKQAKKEMWPEETKTDWREEFLRLPGRILTHKGTLYCKERATQIVAIYVTRAGVNLWKLS